MHKVTAAPLEFRGSVLEGVGKGRKIAKKQSQDLSENKIA